MAAVFSEVFTRATDAATPAEGLIGSANPSSVKDAVDVEGVSPLRRDQRLELFVALVRAFSSCPSESPRNSVHVDIYWEHLSVKCIHHYAFCNLFRDTR